ncbi:hypothetical protein AAC387_Pa06g0861 [Persea americana]
MVPPTFLKILASWRSTRSGVGMVNDGEDDVNGEWVKEGGVLLVDNLGVEGGRAGLDVRFTVRELDEDYNGDVDVDPLRESLWRESEKTMWCLHVRGVEDGGAVLGDGDIAGGDRDHLVHTHGAEGGADDIGNDTSDNDVCATIVLFELVDSIL